MRICAVDQPDLMQAEEFERQTGALAEVECAAGDARSFETLSFWFVRGAAKADPDKAVNAGAGAVPQRV